MNKIVGKRYFRIEFELISPLALCGGDNEETDKDIIVDSLGNPYIPGSSLTGVYRDVLRKVFGKNAEEMYFGRRLELNEGSNESDVLEESRIIVYDAVLLEKDAAFIGKRDMVGLDEYKVAKQGAKFDMQILEPGVKFVTYVEQNLMSEEQNDNVMDAIFEKWEKGMLFFGAKTMRGYGATKASDIKTVEFLNLQTERSRWLDFDLYASVSPEGLWKPWIAGQTEGSKVYPIHVWMKLKQKGGVSIREYSTRVGEADYEQLKLHGKKTAVVPGTSWAGAFRGQMRKLGMGKEDLERVFGTIAGKNASKSHITFSESYIENGEDIVYSRNAIDRFTGGTVDGALYTESTRYNGETELTITCDSEEAAQIVRSYLAACIMDLNAGYLAVGGLTAIGRGLFEIEELIVNGTKFTAKDGKVCIEYPELLESLGGDGK